MHIKNYPAVKLDEFVNLARELVDTKQVAEVDIKMDRPIEMIDGEFKTTGPTIITITIECNYEND